MSVVGDVAFGEVILACDGGDVLHADHLSVVVVAEYDLVGHLLLALLRGCHVQFYVLVLPGHTAAHGGQSLALQRLHHGHLPQTVGGEALSVDGDGDLLLLLAILPHVRHGGQAAQSVAELVAVALQLAVGAVVALQREQQRAGVAKLAVDNHGQHALRQIRLELVDAVAQFGPGLILVVDVVLQFGSDYRHAIHALRGGLLAVYLFEGEQITLQGARHLLLYLFACGAGHHGDDGALAYGELRKLVLGHTVERVDAHRKEHRGHQRRNLIVDERPCHPAFSPIHRS